MKRIRIVYLGSIMFFFGIIFIAFSWLLSYPIHISGLFSPIFNQFHFSLWIGIILGLTGLFLAGYFCQSKVIKAICSSLFPILFYVYVYFYSYLPSSDTGTVRGMFEVFQFTGIKPEIIPYFQYPSFFLLNEITSKIMHIDVKSTAILFFSLYGVLLGLFIFLFLTRNREKSLDTIDFIGVPLYFIATFTFINFQWVPQTLALVYFFILLFLIEMKKISKLLLTILFITFCFTHAFMPVIFILILGTLSIKFKEFFNYFLMVFSIYIAISLYYSTFWFSILVGTIKQTIYGIGPESLPSLSVNNPEEFISQIISMLNRIRIPLALILISIGSIIHFFKKKLNYMLFSIGVGSTIYFGIGFIFSVLGSRALQILCLALVSGIGYFTERWKKPTVIVVIILLLLSFSGPMRMVFDETQFQTDNEKQACDFLAFKITDDVKKRTASSQVNWGYFKQKYQYFQSQYSESFRPGNRDFYDIFNVSMSQDDYVIYNNNLAKEMMKYNIKRSEIYNFVNQRIEKNNKIYQNNVTSIIVGR